MKLFVRFTICLVTTALFLFAYIHKQNQLTELQIQLPQMKKKLKGVEDEITILQVEKEMFENPVHLMELARKPEFSHLKHPVITDVIEVPDTMEKRDARE